MIVFHLRSVRNAAILEMRNSFAQVAGALANVRNATKNLERAVPPSTHAPVGNTATARAAPQSLPIARMMNATMKAVIYAPVRTPIPRAYAPFALSVRLSCVRDVVCQNAKRIWNTPARDA